MADKMTKNYKVSGSGVLYIDGDSISKLNTVSGIILDELFDKNIATNITAIFKICENLIFDKTLE